MYVYAIMIWEVSGERDLFENGIFQLKYSQGPNREEDKA